MDINEIKKLIKVFESSQVTELSISEGDLKIKMSKNGSGVSGYNAAIVSSNSRTENFDDKSSKPETLKEKEIQKTEENLHIINSPIVGTFYRAPAPDADPYVQVGDTVSTGTVLCIVEAMKLMNEIESDVSGKVVKILVDNGTPVEYGQPLFQIIKS